MEILTSSASTFIQDYLVNPTVNQVRYLFCFNNIVEDLHEAEQQLQLAKTDVETVVQIAERNTEKIKEVVQAWLTSTSNILGKVQTLKQKIEANKSCLNGWCPNCGYRYWLGRKATKCTSIMVKLKNAGNFEGVGHRISPPGIEFLTPEGLEFFQSSKRAFDEIMEALKNDNIHTVILHGMGGAGKTTLATSVLKKVKEEGIFNETMMAVVSQTPNFRNIQDRLAERLNLEWDQENTDEGRAGRLFLRFSDSKGRFLVILDDIWEGFNFRDKLGIPVSKRCKLLLTTRNENVCTVEEGQSLIPLNILKKDEGEALLKRQAGIVDHDSDTLNALANEVANECGGLPLALVTVGKFLRGKDIDQWEVVCEKLKKSKLEDIHKVKTNERSVYASLKLSYDYLNGSKIQLCFLLCSLFPEDYEIPLEELVRYGVGLDLYEDVDSIEAARRELRSIVKDLKALGLLLDTDEEGFVKMHDLIRDVALWIASKEKNVFMSKTGMSLKEWSKEKRWEQYTAISSTDNEIEELSIRLDCPNLKILLLGGREYEENLKIPHLFFEEMKALRVLNLSFVDMSLKSLQFLTNLKTLELIECNLMDISFLTQLHGLEILSLQGSRFNVLPRELKELKKLIVLDLLYCEYGNRIPFSEISSFFQLEELHAGDCFEKWEVEEASAKRSNASLSEPISLSNLIVLSLTINVKCLPKDFDHVWHKLLRYDIGINTSTSGWRKNSLRIRDIEGASLIAFKALYHTVEHLFLGEIKGCQNIIPSIDQGGLNKLKSLEVNNCESLEYMLITEKGDDDKGEEISSTSDHETVVLRSLEELILVRLPQLRCIWKGSTHHVNLQSLTTTKVSKCRSLTYLFSLSIAQSLVQLESLEVEECESLEHMFIIEKGDDDKEEEISSTSNNETVVLRSLEELTLVTLPQLRCIWKGPTHHVNLQSLITMKVSKCRSLTYLFSLSIAQSLVQLESLDVEECESLEHLIMIEEGDNDKSAKTVITGEGKDMALINLPKLKQLYLSRLTNLIRFCPEFYISTWPALEELTIVQCSNLSVSFIAEIVDKVQKLRILRIESCNEIVVSGLKDGFFNNLEELYIKDCGVKVLFELEGLCKTPTQVLSLQNLTTSEISNCNRLRNIFSPSLAQNLLQLQVLMIIDCAALEEIVVEDHEEDYSLLFQNLLQIEVVRCPKLRQVFPITIAPCLQKLNYIELNDNSELEEVFGDKDVADVMDHKEIVLPQLNWLSLEKLPGLTNFCPVGYHFIFPSLSDVLVVKACPKMNTRLTLGQDKSVHAEAKALQIVKEDGSAEFPSQPSLEINCWDAKEIQRSLPPFIEYDEQSITHQTEEDNMET